MEHDRIYDDLLAYLQKLKTAVVAFSGGVDSSLLLYAAHKALEDRVMAVTIRTPYIPQWEIEEAAAFARQHFISHKIIELPIPEGVVHNPPDRCYLCKKNLFAAIRAEARALGIETIIEGSNMDDLKDYRPGLRALEELSVVSPFLAQKFTKNQIREVAKQQGLAVWNKPSNACLLSRIPYGIPITGPELERISRAERVLGDFQLYGSRVRSHGDIARVEVPVEQFAAVIAPALRNRLVEEFKSCGYRYVTLDLEGYQSGSMNRDIS